jgi:hypothetical protein
MLPLRYLSAIAVIGGVRQKIHVFFMDIPQSDAPFSARPIPLKRHCERLPRCLG